MSKTIDAKAAAILQRAHDYIEVNGFDINNYEPPSENAGPCCYIGSVRLAAGVQPSPEWNDKGDCLVASAGDGPELVRALEVLDNLAREVMDEGSIKDLEEEYGKAYVTGRLIEDLGFRIRRHETDEAKVALAFFRRALTELHS